MLTQGRTMRATTTRCLKVYIRGGADRQLMARLMADRGIKRVPVLDCCGKLVGIVSRADLVRSMAE